MSLPIIGLFGIFNIKHANIFKVKWLYVFSASFLKYIILHWFCMLNTLAIILGISLNSYSYIFCLIY